MTLVKINVKMGLENFYKTDGRAFINIKKSLDSQGILFIKISLKLNTF